MWCACASTLFRKNENSTSVVLEPVGVSSNAPDMSPPYKYVLTSDDPCETETEKLLFDVLPTYGGRVSASVGVVVRTFHRHDDGTLRINGKRAKTVTGV